MARTPFRTAATVSAVFNPTAVTTFAALTALESTAQTINVSRNFNPLKPTFILFTSGLPAGVFCSPVTITGNDPSSGATPAVYTANFTLYNSTAVTVTPTAQQVILFQL